MRRLWSFSLALVLGLLIAVPLPGADDDEEKIPYPKPGSLIPGPFHVLNVTGPRAGRYHSLVVRYGLQPVIAVFIQPNSGKEIDVWLNNLDKQQPLGTLVNKLHEVGATNPDALLGAFAVFSTTPEEELAVRNRQMKYPEDFRVVMTVADELRQKGMEAWKMKAGDGSDPEVAVVLYDKHKVLKTWTFTKDKPMTEKDAASIAAAFDKMVPDSLRPRQRPLLKLKAKEAAAREAPAAEPKEKEKEAIPKEPKEKKEDKEKDKEDKEKDK
jgi:hypothetical protein